MFLRTASVPSWSELVSAFLSSRNIMLHKMHCLMRDANICVVFKDPGFVPSLNLKAELIWSFA